MPSGEHHDQYATNFREIDWFDLYERRDGYLLFEDLRAQWEQFVKPDYVLIDSRTGHTDTGGICTRQLPDAVAILFFPNDQNLRGLTTVVGDIRSETNSSRKKAIDLHFVMSNVPDLDDEDRVLERQMDAFREKLGFDGEPLTLHRYDSLSLLNQVVFTKERPRSRLAKEYCSLVQKIVTRNLADKDGALEYLRTAGERWRSRDAAFESPDTLGHNFKEIEKAHADDGEVLFALGAFMEDDRQQERAMSFFHRAVEAGYGNPAIYLRLARARAGNEDRTGASEDAMRALQADNLPIPLVRDAVRLVAPDRAKDIASSKAVSSLDDADCIWLARELDRSPYEVGVAAGILEPVVDSPGHGLEESDWEAARSQLTMKYIGMGACDAAAQLLGLSGRDVGEMDVQDAFNYGMAAWGATGKISARPFARVVELDLDDPTGGRDDPDPNYYQCMAIAYWATGDSSAATRFVELARAAVEPVKWEIWSGSMFSLLAVLSTLVERVPGGSRRDRGVDRRRCIPQAAIHDGGGEFIGVEVAVASPKRPTAPDAVDGGEDEQHDDGRRHHAAHHRRRDPFHHLGPGAGAPHDREQAEGGGGAQHHHRPDAAGGAVEDRLPELRERSKASLGVRGVARPGRGRAASPPRSPRSDPPAR